jgi:two-component system, NarL family, response regulator LiaR
MKRHVLIYGLVGGLLIALLKWSEYRFLVVEHSLEIYGGLVAATFAAVGIWLGFKLTRRTETVVIKEVPVPGIKLKGPSWKN